MARIIVLATKLHEGTRRKKRMGAEGYFITNPQIIKSFCGAFYKKRLPEGPPEAKKYL